jgi:hypothetical protein
VGIDNNRDRLYAFGIHAPNAIYTGPHRTFDWRDRSYFAQPNGAQIDAGIRADARHLPAT